MPSIYKLKPAFQKLLTPVLNLLVQAGVTPNQITMAALILSVAGGLMLTFWHPGTREELTGNSVVLWLPVLLFVRMALNALDGMLARTQEMSSRLGEILNELGDVLSDAVLYLPLIFFVGPGILNIVLVVLFTVFAVLCEFSGVLGKAIDGERRYQGPMGKSDRAFIVGFYGLVLYFWAGITDLSTWIFGITTLLMVATCINRVINILTHPADTEKDERKRPPGNMEEMS
ncbi:MAG: CDP-alcohol phosphatidyltransferase family protein [Vampirovibrio sp.]|nr:CDP-alcohol phosphatidyltransferase family protein [Vampirovibrio sp.]